MVACLTLSRFNIDLVDKVNQYFKSLKTVFLLQVERQRSSFRTIKAIGASVTILNLEFLIADILKEQRNLAFTTSKRTYVYKANRTPKDPTRQNKGFKRIESSRPSNCYRRLDRGSSYNILFKDDDDEAFKDIEIEPESDLDLELESFICIIKNFDLDDNKFNCSISSLNSNNSVEDSKTKEGYLAIFNKSKKSLKRSSNRLDLLLYDIGTIDHIVNDRKWFRDDYIFNRGQLRILKIGGGPVIPKGNGTAVFIVLS